MVHDNNYILNGYKANGDHEAPFTWNDQNIHLPLTFTRYEAKYYVSNAEHRWPLHGCHVQYAWYTECIIL